MSQSFEHIFKVARGIVGMLMVLASWNSQGDSRFELVNQQLSADSSERALYYLDRVTQEVFVKRYDKPSGSPFSEPRVSLPILTEELVPADSRSGMGQLKQVERFPLTSLAGQESLKRLIEDGVSPENSSRTFNTLIDKVRKGPSRYKLLQVAENGTNQVGVYHNPDTGEFILQAVENRSGDKHSFALTSGNKADLRARSDKHNSLAFRSIEAKTLNQFDLASAEINRELLSLGFRLPENPFAEARAGLRRVQEGYSRLHLSSRESENGEVFEESLYHPELNKILRRIYRYKADGSQEIIEEEVIDLNNDVGFARSQELYKEELSNSDLFASLTAKGVSCPEALAPIMPVSSNEVEPLVEQVDLVLEKLWEDQIQAGLPESIVIAANNAFVLELSLFGENHSLVGEVNGSAQLVDLNFGNVNKAREAKIRIRHIVGDSGDKQFLVEAFNEYSGEWEAQATLAGETYLDSQGIRRGRLAAHIKGQESSGNISFDDFEKSVYPFKFRTGGILFDADSRIRLNGQRTNPFANMRFEREGDGGLMNFAFQVFLGRSGRRAKVREAIIEEATKTFNDPEYAGLLTSRDIARVADEVTSITEQRTDGFDRSKNLVEAVATAESFSQFGEILIKNFLSDFLKEESPASIQQMNDIVMADFRSCLETAVSARNSAGASQCLSLFTKEAPVSVGELVLKKKLEGAGLGNFADFGIRKYRACIQENYDGVNSSSLKIEGMNRVKDCIYRSVVLSLDAGAQDVVDQKVGAMSQEMGLPLSYSSSKLSAAMETVRSCIKREGLGDISENGAKFDGQKLRSMPTDLFEQGLMYCTNSLVRDVTKEVGSIALAAKLSNVQDLTPEGKARISQAAIGPGLDQCMDRQETYILNARELYRVKRQDLASKGIKEENIDVGVIVPSFDSEECSRILTNLATGHAAKESIDALLGVQLASEAQIEDNYSPLACFQALHEESMGKIPTWIVENSGKNPQELNELQAARDSTLEARSAACLSEAISWASYYAAQDIIEKKLGENPEYAGIDLSSSLKARIGMSVRNCFDRELSKMSSIDKILEEQEKLKDICGAAMLKDPVIQSDLFSPYIAQALKSVDVSEELKERLIVTIRESLGTRLERTATLEEAMGIIDGFKDEAIPLVVEEAIKDKVYEVLSLDINTSNDYANLLANDVAIQIFGANGEGNLGKQLRDALATGNSGNVELVINRIENEAALIIGPKVIRAKGEELLAAGDLESQKEVEDLVSKGSEILTNCLKNTSEAEVGEGKSILDHCVSKTNMETTLYVLDKKVSEQLTTNPLLSGIVSADQIESIKTRLFDAELSQSIAAAGELPEGPEKDAAGSRLILNFKVDATTIIFNEVLSGVAAEKLKTPNGLAGSQRTNFENDRESIVDNSKEIFNTCIAPVKARIENSEEASVLDLDECMNRARLDMTNEILPRRLASIAAKIFPSSELINSLKDKGRDLFISCSDKIEKRSDSKSYGYALDGCLNQAVIDFVGLVIAELKKEEHGLFGAESKISWQSCQEQIERSGMNFIFGRRAPEDMKNYTKEALFTELIKIGESQDPKKMVDTNWLENEIIKCASSKVAPVAVMEFREEFLSRNKDELDAPTEALIFDLTTALVKAWRTPGRNGAPIQVDFTSLLKPSSGQDTAPSSNEETPAAMKPIISLISENEDMAIEYLSLIASYDPEVMKSEVEEFERKAIELSANSTGEVPIENFVDVMSDGNLMDTLIESIIAKTVRDETMKALTDEGADTSVVWLLSSKEMIGRLFSSGKGKEVVEKIKNQYLIPLMKGELSNPKIPDSLMNEAKEILIADTGTNGFVETLFGPIAQKGLSDQKAGIETAWFGKRWGAYWIGYNTDEDFVWGDRYDTSRARFHLRLTPSGHKAVGHFAEEILRPTLMGGLSTSDRDKASGEIEDLLKEAMNENL